MRRIILITGIAVITVWAGFLIHPQVPPEIKGLNIGDTKESVESSVTWIQPDFKDHNQTWLSGWRYQHRAGLTYLWSFDLTFDSSGKLTKIDGRSANEFSGIFDRTYRRE